MSLEALLIIAAILFCIGLYGALAPEQCNRRADVH